MTDHVQSGCGMLMLHVGVLKLSDLGSVVCVWVFFFQAEDGIRDVAVTGVQTCALPISTVRLGALYSGVELPQKFARRGIQREDFLGGSDSIENSSDDERIRLEAAFFLREIGRASCRERV